MLRDKLGRMLKGAALVAVATIITGGCCHQKARHGFIMRGDWSLELNRVPWMNTRLNSYKEDCIATGACTTSGQACSLGDGCAESRCGIEPAQPPARCAEPSCERPGASIDEKLLPPPPDDSLGMRPGPLARLLAGCTGARAAPPPGSQTEPLPHSRFHPVPTRPVFAPRRDVSFVSALGLPNLTGSGRAAVAFSPRAHAGAHASGSGTRDASGAAAVSTTPQQSTAAEATPAPPAPDAEADPSESRVSPPESVPAPRARPIRRPSPGRSGVSRKGAALSQPGLVHDWMLSPHEPGTLPRSPRISRMRTSAAR